MEARSGSSNTVGHSGCNPFRRLFRGRSQVPQPKQDPVEQLLLETISRLEKVEKKQRLQDEREAKAAEKPKRGLSRFLDRFSRSEPKVNGKKKDKKRSKKVKKNAKSEAQIEVSSEIGVTGKSAKVKQLALHGDGNKGKIPNKDNTFRLATYDYQPPKPCLTKYQRQKIILQWAKRQPVTSAYEKLLISIMEDLDAAGDIFNQPRPINKKYAKSFDSLLNEKMYEQEEGEYIIEYGSEYSYEIDFEPVLLPAKAEAPADITIY